MFKFSPLSQIWKKFILKLNAWDLSLIPAEQGRYRLILRLLNFDPYTSRTCAGPWVTLVTTHATMRMSLFWNDGNGEAVKNESMFGWVHTINASATLLYSRSRWSCSLSLDIYHMLEILNIHSRKDIQHFLRKWSKIRYFFTLLWI